MRNRSVTLNAATVLLLMQAASICVPALIVLADVVTNPDDLHSWGGLAAIFLVGLASIYVPIAISLAIGVWGRRAWCRAGILIFETVQALFFFGVASRSGPSLWNVVLILTPVLVVALVFSEGGYKAFRQARPDSWRF